MRVITGVGLARGEALVNFAFSKGECYPSLNIADMVGVVGAYFAQGLYAEDMETHMREHMGNTIAQHAVAVFELFQGESRGGLWEQGAAIDDIRFLNHSLDAMYPLVNRKWSSLMKVFGCDPTKTEDVI